MKILHAGIFDDHVLGGDIIFHKGLLQNGCEVEKFDYRSIEKKDGIDKMFNQFIEEAYGKDLIFIGKGEAFTSKVLKNIRNMKIPIALWYGDMRTEPEEWLLEILPQVDYFFMSSSGNTLKEYFEKGRPHLAAYYFNPSDPELVEKYSSYKNKLYKIVFTGSGYSFSQKERLDAIKYLKKRKDVIFFGGAETIADNEIKKSIKGFLARYFNIHLWKSTPWIRGDDYIKTIRSTLIGVGINGFQNISGYTSDRLSHYTSFGTFYLQWRFPGIEKLFKEGEEIITFCGIDDLDNKLKYYLKNIDERQKIAISAQQKMLSMYNTKNITKMMLEIIETGDSKMYEWVEILKK